MHVNAYACYGLMMCTFALLLRWQTDIDFTRPHELSDVRSIWSMKLPAVFLHFSCRRLGGTIMVPLVSHPTEKQHQWLVSVPSFAYEPPMIGNFTFFFGKSPPCQAAVILETPSIIHSSNWLKVQPKVIWNLPSQRLHQWLLQRQVLRVALIPMQDLLKQVA